jgi:hypothetical protein
MERGSTTPCGAGVWVCRKEGWKSVLYGVSVASGFMLIFMFMFMVESAFMAVMGVRG